MQWVSLKGELNVAVYPSDALVVLQLGSVANPDWFAFIEARTGSVKGHASGASGSEARWCGAARTPPRTTAIAGKVVHAPAFLTAASARLVGRNVPSCGVKLTGNELVAACHAPAARRNPPYPGFTPVAITPSIAE